MSPGCCSQSSGVLQFFLTLELGGVELAEALRTKLNGQTVTVSTIFGRRTQGAVCLSRQEGSTLCRMNGLQHQQMHSSVAAQRYVHAYCRHNHPQLMHLQLLTYFWCLAAAAAALVAVPCCAGVRSMSWCLC